MLPSCSPRKADMRINLPTNYPDTPSGKRTVRCNIYGNSVGYVSGRRFWEFGTDHKSAEFWSKGASLEDAYNKCWTNDGGDDAAV